MNTEVILRVSLLVVITHLIVLLGCSKKKNESQAADFKKKTMRVRVQNNEGTPIKGANIHRSVWTKVPFDANADYITNDNGEANMELPGSMSILRLWATKNGYVPLFVNFDSQKMEGVVLPDEFTFTMEKGTTIGGFVVDASGAPIVNARVEVAIDSRDPDGRGGVAVSRWLAEGGDGCMTDKRGYWSFSNFPPGDNHKIGLRLTHPEYVDDLDYWGFNDTSYFTIEELRKRVARVVMERN
jgi:protocatechuate 3,4-dioxygenase beta subunit